MTTENNPSRYRRMNQVFESPDTANDAISKFWDGVEKLREELKIADVFVAVEISQFVEGDEVRGSASVYFGDHAHKLTMLARCYGAAQADHQAMLARMIAAARRGY